MSGRQKEKEEKSSKQLIKEESKKRKQSRLGTILKYFCEAL